MMGPRDDHLSFYLPSLARQACVCALGLGVHGPIPRTGIATHRPPTARSTVTQTHKLVRPQLSTHLIAGSTVS
jgi:hypothetical protein